MLRVHVLGELALDLDGTALEPPPSRRARALLGFMALQPGTHPRSALAARFWPDVLDESARTSLRGALTAVRRSLGPAADAHLVATREATGLTDAWTDAAEFAALIAAGRDEEALALCRGDLLAGLDDDWLLAARDEQREAQTAALARLADAAGDAEVALRHARARIALDPLSEEAHRDVMTRLAAAGDRAAALAAYNRLADRLRTELRIAPSAATRELAESLRQGEDAPGHLPFPRALDPRRARSPFVGRDVERLRAAVALERPLVAISGDPGIGKTRLLGELARAEQADGATVLYGRCPEEPVAPYQAFAEALRPLPGSPFGEAAAGDAAGARLRLFDAVAAALAEAPGRVLLALDDLHWADKPSVLLLAHLLRNPPPSLAIAATYREVELGRGHPLANALADLRRDRLVERFALGGLDDAAAAGLIEGWVGAGATSGLVAAVHDETGGNPFFIEEVLRHLLESGAIGVDDGRWHLTRPVRELGVPESVREVIGRRLDRLGDGAVEVLQTAAVIGPEFELAVVERATRAERDEVLDALERAADANLIRAVGDRAAAWSFTHALIRDALHDELSGLRRTRLHARVAEALAELGADPGRLARHGLEAAALVGDDRAAGWARAAGDAALAAVAYEEAAEHYRDALELVPGDADLLLALADALLRAGDPGAQKACDAAIAAARDGEQLARAALVACGLGVTIIGLDHDRIALLEEALRGATGALRARVLARLAIALYYAPGGGRADELSAEAVAVAREAGDPDALLAALNARHVGLWHPAGLDERFRVADEMIALARGHDRREAELQGRNWRCVDLWEAGDHEGFAHERGEHERLADELRLPAFRWYAPMWRAAVAARAGRRVEATELADEAAREAARAGDPNGELFRVMLRVQIEIQAGDFTDEFVEIAQQRQREHAAGTAWAPGLCWAYLVRGQVEDGRRIFERLARDDFAAIEENANWYIAIYDFAEIMTLLGEPDGAELLYERLLPYADRRVVAGRAIYDQGSVEYPLGRLAALTGRPEVASRHFEAALAAEEAAGALPNLVVVRARYAELLAAQGDHERARELATAAVRDAGEIGMHGGVAAEAAALLGAAAHG
ncbi:MAG TPA: AAA family ATPase [Solirubrobacteraceae bacterium]|nr:AAA family ATPase [Solirubrobacteraceae bacterium]